MDSVEETEKETLINSGSEDIVVSEETVKQELQFKAPYGVSEMYVTPRNFGSRRMPSARLPRHTKP